MSRVGKAPIAIPSGVTVAINDNNIDVKGKLGSSSYTLPATVSASQENDQLMLVPVNRQKSTRMQWGTSRSILSSMVQGVSEGFTVKLKIVGVGYRAAMQGNTLVLQLGFSHEVKFPLPEGIKIVCENPTSISITGASKQQVGQVAAKIRGYRPPEPYKGKGIQYEGEYILRKEGKKK